VVLAPLRKKKHAEDNEQSKKQMEAKKQQREWLQHTPTPPSSPVFSTPKTIGDIESLANHLNKELDYSLLPNTLEYNIRAFLKGSSAKALAGQLAENDLAVVKNRNNSKAVREKNGRRVI